jgi:hypothetical protein
MDVYGVDKKAAGITKIKPDGNAVIVQYINGKRVIRIHCKDESLLPQLENDSTLIYMLFNGPSR